MASRIIDRLEEIRPRILSGEATQDERNQFVTGGWILLQTAKYLAEEKYGLLAEQALNYALEKAADALAVCNCPNCAPAEESAEVG